MRDSDFPGLQERVSVCDRHGRGVRQLKSPPSPRDRAPGVRPDNPATGASGADGQALVRNLHVGSTAAVAVVRASDWRMQFVSCGLEMQLGYLPGELDDVCLLDVFEDPGDLAQTAESVAGDERPGGLAVSLRGAEGERTSALVWALRLDAGATPALLLVFTPLPAEEPMGAVSGQDPATGLGSRRHFLERLGAALAGAGSRQELIGCLLVQLEGIETAYGEDGDAVGDKAVSVIARRLQRTVRSYDTVARLGPGRLGIVVERLRLPVHALRAAQHVNHALTEPISIPGARLRPCVRIGVAVYPGDACSTRGLLRRANAALKAARRRRGRNVVSAASP